MRTVKHKILRNGVVVAEYIELDILDRRTIARQTESGFTHFYVIDGRDGIYEVTSSGNGNQLLLRHLFGVEYGTRTYTTLERMATTHPAVTVHSAKNRSRSYELDISAIYASRNKASEYQVWSWSESHANIGGVRVHLETTWETGARIERVVNLKPSVQSIASLTQNTYNRLPDGIHVYVRVKGKTCLMYEITPRKDGDYFDATQVYATSNKTRRYSQRERWYQLTWCLRVGVALELARTLGNRKIPAKSSRIVSYIVVSSEPISPRELRDMTN